jgi:hypothetical protein
LVLELVLVRVAELVLERVVVVAVLPLVLMTADANGQRS